MKSLVDPIESNDPAGQTAMQRTARELLRLPLTRVRVPDQLSSDGPIVLRPHQTQFATLLFLTLSGFSSFPLFSLSPISNFIHTFCFPSTVTIQLAPRSFQVASNISLGSSQLHVP